MKEYRPKKKRPTRIPLKRLLPPPVAAPQKPVTSVDESVVGAEPDSASVAPAATPPRGGKARAKKIGKTKQSRITRKIDRMKWNSKKKRSY